MRSEPKSMDCQTVCDSASPPAHLAGSSSVSSVQGMERLVSGRSASSEQAGGPPHTAGLQSHGWSSAADVVARLSGSLSRRTSSSRRGGSDTEPQPRPEKVSGFSRTARAGSERPRRLRRENGSCRLRMVKAMSPAPQTSAGGPLRPSQLSGDMYIAVPARGSLRRLEAVLSVTGSGRTHDKPRSKSFSEGSGSPGTTRFEKPKFSGLMSRWRAPILRWR
mmetsp:Transcript_37493/g.101494  ORF Transcript_37493/g.101494 Transcript_37493/m.101494 type:complete len:220 (+) Transcript_37493:115-774(+)